MMHRVKLGPLVEIKTGKLDANAEAADGQYPFFTCSKDNKRINRYSFDGEYVIVAGNGDLNVKYYSGKFDAYQRTYTLKPSPHIDGKFLFHFMSKYVDRLREQSIGGVIKYIKLGNLTDALIPLPPLEEQKKIAAILDAADDYRQKTKALIDKYDQLTQSLFLDMFGDPVTNSKGWRITTLNEVCFKITDGTHHSPPLQKDGHPYVTAKHVKAHRLDFYSKPTFVNSLDHNVIFKRCSPAQGDLLYIKDGATTGAACINTFNQPISLLSSLALLKLKSCINNQYLCFWLNNPGVKRKLINEYMSGAAIKRYTLKKIKTFKLMLPPIFLQNQFAERVAQIEKQKQQAEASLVRAEELFSSLLQRAFKGELTS